MSCSYYKCIFFSFFIDILLVAVYFFLFFFFFQAEDGIRDYKVTGVQTCALPISVPHHALNARVDAGRRTRSLRPVMATQPQLGGPMRWCLWSLVGFTLAATPLEAQGLRDKISQLFIFADGKDPLFIGGTAGSDSATALHADHFVPSAVSDNGTLVSFIGTAISQNVANLPVSATSGGSTFRFEGGVPVPTSRSPGSVFGERAQTLGRGRVFIGANVNRLHLETLRGVSLNGIEMTFTHQNVTGPSCDSLVGASCARCGVPRL